MVHFPGEDCNPEWKGTLMSGGVTFFKAAKWLLECFDRELDNIAYMCRYNIQGRANSSGTTAVL